MRRGDATPTRRNDDLTRGALNKYSVHSMTHDIRRSLMAEKYPNDGLIELSQDKWFDPHSSGMETPSSGSRALMPRKDRIGDEAVGQRQVNVHHAGTDRKLADTETGLVMNAHPGAPYFKKFGTRFKFIDYGFQEIVKELRSLLALVRQNAQPGIRFIVTVSPVPLGSRRSGRLMSSSQIVAPKARYVQSQRSCAANSTTETHSPKLRIRNEFPSRKGVARRPAARDERYG